MTHLILLRHCESQININDMIAGHTHTDATLTVEGEKQAAKLAKRVQEAHPGIEHIYCSTAMRTRQTAAFIVETMGIPISYHDELLERNYGKFDGMTMTDAAKKYPEEWAVWKKTREVEGGETAQQVSDRAGSISAKAFTTDGHNTIAIVTHLSVLRAFMGRDGNGEINSWPLHEYGLGSISTIKTYDADKPNLEA